MAIEADNPKNQRGNQFIFLEKKIIAEQMRSQKMIKQKKSEFESKKQRTVVVKNG